MAKLKIGVLVSLHKEPEPEIKKVADLGLRSCQICSWAPDDWNDEVGKKLSEACAKYGVEVSTFWSGCTGPYIWNFIEGPGTIGLVPPQYREMRVAELKKAADFAAKFKLPSITTHVGFIPEDPNDPKFAGTVEACSQVASHCKKLGIGFWFESGQETPVTLLRTIQKIGLDNLGINFDTANVILYGKANPVDAIDVFGKYVRNTHIKDGFYPTDGMNLGNEAPLGKGKVDFAQVVKKLKKLGYSGPLTIEREISGDQQIKDIKKAIKLLDPLR
jgi:L-ribulose-5-phosphate 3-epimerase